MVLIRRARAADAAGIGRAYVETWRSTYPGMLPASFLAGLSEQGMAQRWRNQLAGAVGDGGGIFVAVERPLGIVGFGTCGVQRSRVDGFDGEIYTLYLLDSVQGQGLGRRLMAAMAGDLLGRGYLSGLVWVLRENPSRWFYERMGGERLAEQTICLAKTLLTEVAYGWRDLAMLARTPINPPPE